MLYEWWHCARVWLEGLQGGAAAFVASSFAFFAAIAAALFNAHLNRRRDKWLRRQEAHSLRTGLKAELNGWASSFSKNAAQIAEVKDDDGHFLVPVNTPLIKLDAALIGLLRAAEVDKVIAAYGVIAEQEFHLKMLGGNAIAHGTGNSYQFAARDRWGLAKYCKGMAATMSEARDVLKV